MYFRSSFPSFYPETSAIYLPRGGSFRAGIATVVVNPRDDARIPRGRRARIDRAGVSVRRSRAEVPGRVAECIFTTAPCPSSPPRGSIFAFFREFRAATRAARRVARRPSGGSSLFSTAPRSSPASLVQSARRGIHVRGRAPSLFFRRRSRGAEAGEPRARAGNAAIFRRKRGTRVSSVCKSDPFFESLCTSITCNSGYPPLKARQARETSGVPTFSVPDSENTWDFR